MSNQITPEIIGWAQDAEKAHDVPAAMNVAAAIVESGLGTYIPPGSNNWHGIKAPIGGVVTDTKEQSEGGAWYTIKAGFRAFKSPADSFMYYAYLISTGAPYREAFDAYAKSPKAKGDVETLTRAIATKYATALSYAKTLVSVEEQRNLFPYDTPGSWSSRIAEEQRNLFPYDNSGSRPTPPVTPKPAAPPAMKGNLTVTEAAQAVAATDPMATIQKFLTLIEKFPFSAVVPALTSGGTNIPADIYAAEALIQEFSSGIALFYGDSPSPSPAPASATTSANTGR